MTYSELYDDVRGLLRQNATSIPNTDIERLHRVLAGQLQKRELPVLKMKIPVAGADLARGYGLDEIIKIVAVYDPMGERLDTAVSAYQDADTIPSVVIDGNSVTGIGAVGEDTYTIHAYKVYTPRDDGAGDVVLVKERDLLLKGLIYRVLKWQKAPAADLDEAAAEYEDAYEDAKKQNYNFVQTRR